MEKEVLKDLHILSNIFENLGYAKEAQVVNEVFVKVAKTKAKKKKNVPTNPSLWSECKAWAKRTFDVYPCVPLDSMALTKKGWAEYSDLSIGDEILTYNQSKDKLEWKPIVNLHFYEDAPTLSLKKLQTNLEFLLFTNHLLTKPTALLRKHKEALVLTKGLIFWQKLNLKLAVQF